MAKSQAACRNCREAKQGQETRDGKEAEWRQEIVQRRDRKGTGKERTFLPTKLLP